MPDTYVGTKMVHGTPMKLNDYLTYRGWKPEVNNEEGYLVEYLDGGEPNHPDHAGYISWSPKDVFERSYRRSGSGLSFSAALDALKKGHRIAREGWNGKGMWLCLSGPLEGRTIPAQNFWSKHCSDFAKSNDGSANVLPCINMKTADGSILMGWLASQTDMLSDDWVILD